MENKNLAEKYDDRSLLTVDYYDKLLHLLKIKNKNNES